MMHKPLNNFDLFDLALIIEDQIDLLELLDDLAEAEDRAMSSYYLGEILEAYHEDLDQKQVESESIFDILNPIPASELPTKAGV